MSERERNKGRRVFCKAACAAGGLVALSAAPGCGTADTQQAACSVAAIGVGDAASLGVGQVRYIESQALFICHDEGGYYAVDAACTHIGTLVDFVSPDAGFKCPLHGATFAFSGKVLTGPAMRDLPHFSLCTTESGILIVDTAKRVTLDTRLVV